MQEGGGNKVNKWCVRPIYVPPADVRAASYDLNDRHPLLCCRHNPRLPSVLPLSGLCLGIFGLQQPAAFLSGMLFVLLPCFSVLILWRAGLCVLGAFEAVRPESSPEEADVGSWPRYSILVPLYREAGSVPGLVATLNGMEYPADRLEILFLTEMEDVATRAAMLAEPLHSGAQILSLPDGQPRTKPRALNVALRRLTGELVTIYDAEDRPHPLQLKSAALALKAGGAGLACVQAPLRAYNASANWLSGQWGLEYSLHFG